MEPEKTLEQVFNFTAGDLDDNRRGKLSNAQAQFLRRRAFRNLSVVAAIVIILTAMAIFSARPSSSEMIIFEIVMAIPIIVALALTVGTTEFAIGPRVVAKRTGQVKLSDGPNGFSGQLDPKIQMRMGAGRYIMINDAVFQVSHEEHDILKSAIYTVYFLPTLRRIVAIEPVTLMDEPVAETPGLLNAPVVTTVTENDNGEALRA